MQDWIVIFGAAVRDDGTPSGVLKRRIEGGYSAWRRLPQARLLLSGAAADHRPSEAAVMRDVLLAKGVPEDALLLDESSRDTFDSALAAWRLLGPAHPDIRLWACSSGFHNPRCRLLLRLQGFRTGAVQIPPSRHRLSRGKYLYWCLREIPAIPWDAFLMVIELIRRRRTRPEDAGSPERSNRVD